MLLLVNQTWATCLHYWKREEDFPLVPNWLPEQSLAKLPLKVTLPEFQLTYFNLADCFHSAFLRLRFKKTFILEINGRIKWVKRSLKVCIFWNRFWAMATFLQLKKCQGTPATKIILKIHLYCYIHFVWKFDLFRLDTVEELRLEKNSRSF